DTNCTLCHGFKNTGNPPYPKLSDIQKSDSEIRKILTEGYGGMPSFGNFSSEEIDNLIAYLRSNDEDASNAALVSSDTTNHIPRWSGTGSGGDWSTTTPQYINKVHHFVDHMGFPAIK